MKKKILGLLVMVACFFGMSSVNATIINTETGDQIYFTYATSHQYDGQEYKPQSTLRDGEYDLVEGVDFKRVYWTTQDCRLDPQDIEAADETPNFVRPGFVWESITGIGKYSGKIDNRHTIYVYMGTTPYSYSKYVGEDDQTFKAYDIFFVNGAWVKGDTIEANVVSSYELARTEGEEVGKYTISLNNVSLTNPALVAKEATYSESLKASLTKRQKGELFFTLIDAGLGNGYLMSNGYVFYKPFTSKLTIKDYAKVVVNYVDEDGKALADSETIEGKVDEDYKTEAKEIKDYELVEVKGEETGKFTEEEITVTYVYQFVMGQGEDEEEIVNTGSKVNVALMSAVSVIISALSLSLVSKKRNN